MELHFRVQPILLILAVTFFDACVGSFDYKKKLLDKVLKDLDTEFGEATKMDEVIKATFLKDTIALRDEFQTFGVISYNISKYPTGFDSRIVDKRIAEAFALWGKYIYLTFEPNRTRAIIDISFETGEHGDLDPFDGEGGILAHVVPFEEKCCYQLHFDDSEPWTDYAYDDSGPYFFAVAVHEIGHILGLPHSRNPLAIMWSKYSKDPIFDLHRDDVRRIQEIWPARPSESTASRIYLYTRFLGICGILMFLLNRITLPQKEVPRSSGYIKNENFLTRIENCQPYFVEVPKDFRKITT